MLTVKKILKGRALRRFIMNSLRFLPDALYVSLFYWAATGKWPNLKNPQGFNEKLQWLKLHEDYSQYRDYTDKIKVREIIKEKLGDGYMFPILGKWKSFDEIDFSALPEEFVLKCNHDSGSVKLIHSKSSLTDKDYTELKRFFDSRMKYDFYLAGREPCYKGIDRYIFAEELMKDSSGDPGGIKDYKFYCFDGEPYVMLIVSGRQGQKHEDYFDMKYNCLHLTNGSTESQRIPEMPALFNILKDFARQLSQGMKHVRMDFYEIDGKIYFGEFTFFSGGGFELFYPEEWEKKLGSWIDLDRSKVKDCGGK